MQDIIRQQESSKNEILTSLSRKGDLDKEKLSEENRRLNDKIQLITNEVTKNMNEREHKLKDDIYQKLNAMQAVFHHSFFLFQMRYFFRQSNNNMMVN